MNSSEVYIPLDVTPDQRQNLTTLAAWLIEHADTINFDMTEFADHENADVDVSLPEMIAAHSCGAIGCAVGHGPLAGIAPLPDEVWRDYASRVFGAFDNRGFMEEAVWVWCFAASWADTDNTASGAGRRIQYALEHGLPENYRSQAWGEAPLDYDR